MDLWICDCEIFVWGKMDKRLQVQHFHVFSCTSSSSWPSPFISTASPIFCLSLLHPLPNNPCPLRCAVPPSVAAHFPSAFSSVQTSAGLSFLTNHSLLDFLQPDICLQVTHQSPIPTCTVSGSLRQRAQQPLLHAFANVFHLERSPLVYMIPRFFWVLSDQT